MVKCLIICVRIWNHWYYVEKLKVKNVFYIDFYAVINVYLNSFGVKVHTKWIISNKAALNQVVVCWFKSISTRSYYSNDNRSCSTCTIEVMSSVYCKPNAQSFISISLAPEASEFVPETANRATIVFNGCLIQYMYILHRYYIHRLQKV